MLSSPFALTKTPNTVSRKTVRDNANSNADFLNAQQTPLQLGDRHSEQSTVKINRHASNQKLASKNSHPSPSSTQEYEIVSLKKKSAHKNKQKINLAQIDDFEREEITDEQMNFFMSKNNGDNFRSHDALMDIRVHHPIGRQNNPHNKLIKGP